MYIPRRRKARLKMGLMIAISSLSIGALAASTMAWYSVNTSITVESSTVSIRTALQYNFYAFKDNGFVYDTNTPRYVSGSGYSTFGDDHSLNDIDDYVEVNELADYGHKTALVQALTKVSGLWPGYKMSFAVKVSGLQTTDLVSLKFVANSTGFSAGVSAVKDYNTDEPEPVTLAHAIKLTAGSGKDLGTAVTNSTSSNTDTYYRNYENNVITKTWYNYDHVFGAAAPTDKITEWWWVFTIEFSNDSSTWYTRTSGADTAENHGIYTQDGEHGNSSCYEGLTFNLGTLDLN